MKNVVSQRIGIWDFFTVDWEKRYFFAIGNEAYIRPQILANESPGNSKLPVNDVTKLDYFLFKNSRKSGRKIIHHEPVHVGKKKSCPRVRI